MPLKERYETYIKETGYILPSNDDVLNFYLHTSSLYAQALSIISLCVRFNIYPYIRENTIFYNFVNLLQNFEKIISPKIKELSLIHFLFFTLVDDYLEIFSLEKIKTIKQYDLINIICLRIREEKVPICGPGSFNKIQGFIIEELERIGINI